MMLIPWSFLETTACMHYTSLTTIAISQYGAIDSIISIETDNPKGPQGHDVLVQIQACSINPVDTKVRAGTYDDYPDYYARTPPLPHIIGLNASGTILQTG
ncbi:hypothetical protein BST61_g8081 [Cercospora zeina]